MKTRLWVSLVLFMISSSFLAEAENRASHEAHVHGMAELTLALEKTMLEIQIESPAMNLIGFEHKAITMAEREAVKKAEALLLSSQRLFSFNGTRCDLRNVSVDISGVISNEHDDHEHHHKDYQESHSEIIADYHFSCDSDKDLISVSVELFDQFPGVEKINAMWVTETQQGADTLNAEKRTIRLR